MSSEMFFEGDSSNNGGALWLSNGTLAGTKRIKLTNQNANGLVAVGDALSYAGPIVLSYDGMTFLQGGDAQGHVGLFVYNDATGASSELAGAEGSNQFGIDPSDFIAYHGEVYFQGYDSNLNRGLWVTNGTKSGTHEIAGSAATLQAPQAMTVYNGLLYMAAIGSNGNWDLFDYNAWTGTFAEFYADLAPNGDAPQATKAFSVGSSTGALNSELFVNGDYKGAAALIVWKGVKGTAFTTESKFGGLAPVDLAGLDWSTKSDASTVHYGAVFFSGVDNSSRHRGLWETNGATVKELAASTFAGGQGGLDPFDLTAFDGKIYFTGYDKYTPFDDGRGLFVYNPATNATSELIKSSTLDLTDGFASSWVDSEGFYNSITMGVFNGKLYFGADNPKAGGAASVSQLYQYSGSGSSPTLMLVAGASAGGLTPMSFGATT